jgi:CheY-like chemotaxis protein
MLEARNKGIDAVLAKPYRPDELLRVLAQVGRAVQSLDAAA